MIVRGEMVLAPYAILMTVLLIVNLLIVAAILAILDIRPALSPLRSQNIRALLCAGFLTGFLVMSAVLLAIVGTGSAALTGSGQSVTQAVSHCLGWLPFDFLGATGEELFGRVALLVVAERFVGKPGAALASGGLFFVDHLGNPGASAVWLFRLFIQGVLLSYAVFRTRSVWWSAGYHTGWNWASAPVFGAVGSGYLNYGHALNFVPTGSVLITGGAVGPEGSLFSFVAMFVAFLMLRRFTRDDIVSTDVGTYRLPLA
ncbi:CPBP family intramembrane glutamic endopeptidase [Novosphingobium clariflavum]|uniref:CPBP family intramembrane glutamic endopeptidase n=1 Tax=Novosphingobium clariflavum TaxID=2029884 RepID=A0ABV6S7N0_9SPHN|nr:CPBP family intramembrane glutamic endopeptidase [Novosphingobium clariflavum]